MSTTELSITPSNLLPTLLRFADLKSRRYVGNRVTLKRWIDAGIFPKPILLGPNSLAWRLSDVEAWLAQRAALPGVAQHNTEKHFGRNKEKATKPARQTPARRGSAKRTAHGD